MRLPGRKQPYTERGIGRVPCARCGAPSVFQWNCCAIDNRYLGVCGECDILLNMLGLRFFRVPNADHLNREYAARVRRIDDTPRSGG